MVGEFNWCLCAFATADPRGCAVSTVQPCPSLGRVPASEPGLEDHLERQERRREQRHSPVHGRRRHHHHRGCRCRRLCGRPAASVAASVPLRCRLVAASVPAIRDRGQPADLDARRVFCCLGLRWASVGGGGGSQKRIFTYLYAFTCCSRWPPWPSCPALDETAEIGPVCAYRLIPCRN